MLMLIEFDVDADIIEVPQIVIDNKDRLKKRFLNWLYNKRIKHKYWITVNGSKGVCFRSDAFVEWLNLKVLNRSEQQAVIVQQHVPTTNDQQLPSIFF